MSQKNSVTIVAASQQQVYENLSALARLYDESDSVEGVAAETLPTLSEYDLQDADRLGLRASLLGQLTPLLAEQLQVVLARLQNRDQEPDEKFDDEFLEKDLNVDFSTDLSNPEIQQRIQAVAARFEKSVFQVVIFEKGLEQYWLKATGFVFKKIATLPSEDKSGKPVFVYHVLTNAHVAADHEAETWPTYRLLMSDERPIPELARLVGVDPLADLAVLEIRTTQEFPPFEAVSANPVDMEEVLLEMGNTHALGVTTLPVQVVRVNDGMSNYAYTHDDNYPFETVYVTGNGRPGNSGSVVVNLDGELVAVHHSGSNNRQKKREYSIFMTSGQVEQSYRKILAEAERSQGVVYSTFGLYANPVLPGSSLRQTFPEDLRSKGAVALSKVYPGGPADQAGLLPGDVIYGLREDGGPDSALAISSEDEMWKFLTAELYAKPGVVYKVSVFRPSAGATLELALTPAEKIFRPSRAYRTPLGFSVAELRDDQREKYGLQGINGVYVTNMHHLPNRFYENAETLCHNLIITAINSIPIADLDGFQKTLDEELKESGTVRFTALSTSLNQDEVQALGGTNTVYTIVYKK